MLKQQHNRRKREEKQSRSLPTGSRLTPGKVPPAFGDLLWCPTQRKVNYHFKKAAALTATPVWKP